MHVLSDDHKKKLRLFDSLFWEKSTKRTIPYNWELPQNHESSLETETCGKEIGYKVLEGRHNR